MEVKKENHRLNKVLFFSAATIIIILMLFLTFATEEIGFIVNSILYVFRFKVGGLYVLLYLVSLGFSLYLICSKHGDTVLGGKEEKPEYSTYSWVSMVFCSAVASVMVLPYVEPIYFLMGPPFGIEPLSAEAYEMAHMYGQFHWGFSANAIYVPFTLMIAYHIHVKKGKEICIGSILHKNSKCNRFMGTFVDVIIILVTIAAVGTTMGISSPLVCAVLSNFLGIENSNTLKIFVYIVWFLVFSISVYRGLEKGIKKLSQFNVVLALLLVAVIFLVAGPFSVLDAELNSIGLYIQNFVRMSFNTDPFGKGGFPQQWTIFYWAWNIAYAPSMGIFIARISKGRTVRQVAGGVMFAIALAIIPYTIMGYYSLSLQMNGVADLVQTMSLYGQNDVILQILQTLPLSKVFSVVYCVSIIVFVATTIDSEAYVLASASLVEIKGDEQPPRRHRIFWAGIVIVFSLLLTAIGGLETMQTVSVIFGFPMIFVQLVVMIVILRMLKKGS